jgi:catechol-2,3-dioxygenase
MPRTLLAEGSRVVPIRFAHAVFLTRRYAEMVEWWKELLQAEIAFANPRLTFMTYDDEHHRIAIANVPNLSERPAGAEGLDHVAYTFGSLGELLYTYRRLGARGIQPVWCVNHGPTTSMYYRDPDGNKAELQVDNFPDVASLNAWFRSGAFAQNPIGVDFDPEKLLAKWLDGVPESELVRQGSA